jgi:molybdate transport system ATP-binding protein
VTTESPALHAAVTASAGSFVLHAGLDVDGGATCAVTGANGTGKTTLLRALAGLTPLDAGVVRFGDTVWDDPSTDTFVAPERRDVGMVFADGRLFGHLDVRDNVAFGLRAHGTDRRIARRRADDWLARVGMHGRGDAAPATLSSGETQRVALARALAVGPGLLLLDEPLASVDAAARPALRELIASVTAEFGGVTVVATHDTDDVAALGATRVTLDRDAT